jgi:hypothetical protein
MRHTARGQRYKVAHRISESDNLKVRGGCNVWIRTAGDHSDYLPDRLAASRFVRTKSHGVFASAAPHVTFEPVRLPSRTWIGAKSYDFD